MKNFDYQASIEHNTTPSKKVLTTTVGPHPPPVSSGLKYSTGTSGTVTDTTTKSTTRNNNNEFNVGDVTAWTTTGGMLVLSGIAGYYALRLPSPLAILPIELGLGGGSYYMVSYDIKAGTNANPISALNAYFQGFVYGATLGIF